MLGMGSQMAFCFPEKNFMFVCQGDTQCDGDTEGDYIYEQLVHEVYENITDEQLQDSDCYQQLNKELENLELNVDYGKAHEEFEKEI